MSNESRPMLARRLATLVFSAVIAIVAGCASQPPAPISRAAACPAVKCPACPACPPVKPEAPPTPTFTPASFADLPGWARDDPRPALAAFRVGCQALRNRNEWRAVCERALGVPDGDARAFFEREFGVWQINNADGTTNGLVTGYYEPLLRGSRVRSATYRFPVLAPPDDLLVVDLAGVAPDTRNMRLRGRLDGRRIVPYWSRADIEAGRAPIEGKAIAWVDDPIELFFLQVQGSGRLRLPDGGEMRVGYADQNGHPYRSIGRWLVDIGALKVEEASMQGIQAWAQANPQRVDELLNQNPSYVFFREVPAGDIPPGLGARGSLGVPLTPERSIAVDHRFVPLGAPVWLATTRPNDATLLERLMVAQDTGGAIRGAVRADFFWGFGAEPAALAGRMRQQGRMWALLPRDYPVPTGTASR